MNSNAKSGPKRKVVMILVWVLVVFLIGSFLLPTLVAYGGYSQKDIDNLEDKLDGIDDKKAGLQSDIKDTQAKKKTQMEQKVALEEQIRALESQISDTNDRIAALDGQLETKNEQIADIEKRYGEEYEKYKKRVKYTYEEGTVDYLSVILSADSFGDMLTRLDFVSMMIDRDKETMDTLTGFKNELNDAKTAIEQTKQEQDALKNQLSSDKAAVDQKAKECDALLAQISATEDSLEAALAEAVKYEQQIEAEIKRITKELAKQNTVYVGGDYGWPLPGGPSNYTVTSSFGYRYHPVLHYNKLHTGVDLGASKGTAIYAANDGTVIKSTTSTAYGNYVMIDHGGGQVTLYAHMSQRCCSKGDKVKRGDLIGKVGATGYATGNHLHFEIIINGEYQNPMTYFK